MKQELQEKLYKKYPKLFTQKDWSIRDSCMPWGIECGSGWYHILDKMCSLIQNDITYKRNAKANILRYNRALQRAINGNTKYLEYHFKRFYKDPEELNKRIMQEMHVYSFLPDVNTTHQVQFSQIKEKYGTLRVYANYASDFAEGVIDMACSMSSITCEQCGMPGKMRGAFWYYVSCDEHANPEDKDSEDEDQE